MQPLRVLVTSAGAAPAIAVINALRQQRRYPVVIGTVDMQPYSVGKLLGDWHEMVPAGSSPEYIPALQQICAKHGVQYVFPIIDEELLVWADHAAAFAAAGVHVFINPPECVSAARDKRATLRLCAERAIAAPRGYSAEEALGLDPKLFPVFGKPRFGRGSVGTRRLSNPLQVREFLDEHADGVIQEFLVGPEYTVDIILDDKGKLIGAVPKRRLELKAGMATRSRTENAPDVIELATCIARAFHVRGAANVQLMRDATGSLKMIELNPKFAASLPLTVAAGFNIPQILLELARAEYQGPRPIPFTADLLMLRCWQEHFVDCRNTPMGHE